MERMKFEEFKNEIVNKIQAYLPERFKECEVSLQLVKKNNNLTLTGLLVKTLENNIAPTIYLEQFYQKYQDGTEFEEILRGIAELRITHELEDSFDVEQITNWSRCKSRIVPRLVGTEGNSVLLNDRPHTVIADLAVTYCILLEESVEDGSLSVPITNQLMKGWNITLDELHNVAVNNLTNLLPTTFKGMSEVMSEMMGMDIEEFGITTEEEPMYVLTNNLKLNGAAALLDKKMMGEIVDRLGAIYILPSSIHEVLVVPAKSGMDIESLEMMVSEVNENEVSPEERLSNHVYTYSLADGLRIA